VDNVRRGSRARKVVHAFVKARMGGDLDMVREGIEPEDVASSVREKTKKGALHRVRKKFCGATTGRADPDATTKRTEVREVVNLTKGKG
jgi:hypothetical protein